MVVQVIHTGSAADLDIGCKIKGGKQIKKLTGRKYDLKPRKMKMYVAILEAIICTIMLIFEWLIAWDIIPVNRVILSEYIDESTLNKIGSVIVTVVYVIAMATLYNDIKKKYYINIPKKSRESMEDSGFQK